MMSNDSSTETDTPSPSPVYSRTLVTSTPRGRPPVINCVSRDGRISVLVFPPNGQLTITVHSPREPYSPITEPISDEDEEPARVNVSDTIDPPVVEIGQQINGSVPSTVVTPDESPLLVEPGIPTNVEVAVETPKGLRRSGRVKKLPRRYSSPRSGNDRPHARSHGRLAPARHTRRKRRVINVNQETRIGNMPSHDQVNSSNHLETTRQQEPAGPEEWPSRIDPDAQYCYCAKKMAVNEDGILHCYNKLCPWEKFHARCTGSDAGTLDSNAEWWYCPTCREKDDDPSQPKCLAVLNTIRMTYNFLEECDSN